MTSRRPLAALAGAALLVLLAIVFWPHDQPSLPASVAGPAPVTVAPSATRPNEVPGTNSSGPAAMGERSELADQLNSPAQDIHADLRLVAGIFDAFRSNFPHAGNPIGNNAEITAVLTGNNPLHVAFIPPDHPAINARGELCDRWGRPFFFHQLSGTRMEIRSAGPDQKFWTADDVVLTP
jgi:hypothetical protein